MISTFTTDEYRWLSNFYPCPITFDGREFKSVEHAYMSAKSDSEEWKNFCLTENAGSVKRKSYELTLDSNWSERKISVMKECITKKFTQEPFRTMLLNTGDEYIQEGNFWHDQFWGVDLTTSPPEGLNMLGKLIMEVRSNLISDAFL